MNTQTIDLGFRPRQWQIEALRGLKRFSVLLVHRRAGKTVLAVMKLIDSALRCKLNRGHFAYIAPELKQAKGLAWEYLKDYGHKVPGSRVNESELWVEFPNGAKVRIFGADYPDSLRGYYFDGVVLDEVAQMKPTIWGEVLIPALADRKGWCLLMGTPKGINMLSERYFRALEDPEWYCARFDYNQTQVLDELTIADMRKEMTEREWRQEMLLDFDASSDDTLISIDLVRGALGKHYQAAVFNHSPKIIGVDVALGGGDKTVIQTRQGLASFPCNVLDMNDPGRIGDVVARTIDVFQPQAVFVDGSGGYGSGVVSRLTQLGYGAVMSVQFGGSASTERYRNKRTEMWWDMKVWLEEGGALPPDQRYLADLTGPRYSTKNAKGQLELETKDQMKSRGLRSPDLGDALALTFAYPVAPKPVDLPEMFAIGQPGFYKPGPQGVSFLPQASTHLHDYSPLERFDGER